MPPSSISAPRAPPARAPRSSSSIAVYIANVAAVLSPRRIPDHGVDEIRQTVRERLLAGDPPYLATAAGRGSLAGLVAVIATRAGLDWLRARSRAEARHEDSPRDLVASSDPERDHLRARFRGDVKTAFEAAVKDLEPRDRTMLRFHLVEGMTIDDVARLYQIHRATAARQIEKARDKSPAACGARSLARPAIAPKSCARSRTRDEPARPELARACSRPDKKRRP